MPTIPDASFSMVANSALPITATSTILAAFITPAIAAATLHYALQRKVSVIRIATMRDSLSWKAGLQGLFKGRTLTMLSCIREVQGFETHIKILKEAHLRQSNLNPLFTRAVSLDLRRRCHGAGHGPAY
ncbi:hypothetical protein B0H13DRAFT_1957073 [Mycena leptocephala]|nr:hypothetical protein B0H13DRAFT_1957073 [Mycena leptocephala]